MASFSSSSVPQSKKPNLQSTSFSSQMAPSLGSSSSASKGPQVANSGYFCIEDDVHKADTSSCKYSLSDMATELDWTGLDARKSKCYVEQLFGHMFPDDFTLSVDKEIKNMKLFAGLESSTTQRIDVVVYAGEERRVVATAIEVQSSPMSETIYKSILGTADIIRLARIHDVKTTQFISFAVPSLTSKGCIVKIVVKWHMFSFKVNLTTYEDIKAGLTEMENIAKIQRVKLPETVRLPDLIRLSSDDIKYLVGSGGCQIHSHRHIVIEFIREGSRRICKIVYKAQEKDSFRYYESVTATRKPRWGVDAVVRPSMPSCIVYTYCAAKYDPLSREEARLCLKDLLYSMKETLDDFHSLGLSHNDVRLPNICFDEDFHAVLIDIDTCWSIAGRHPYFGNSKSCMYNDIVLSTGEMYKLRTGDQTDFRQLGWLAAFILEMDTTVKEHDRTFEDLPDIVKNCEFLVELLKKGTWNTAKFENCDFGPSYKLQDIIQKCVQI